MIKKLAWLLLTASLASCTAVPPSPPVDASIPDPSEEAIAETVPLEEDVSETSPPDVVSAVVLESQQQELDQLTDVWQRIRLQPQIDVPDRTAVKKYRQFYRRYQSLYNQISVNAEPFLYHIVLELEQRQMPVELALIPIIESSYNPKAQAGAPAGLWQMVPQTARNFGLTRNQWYDGRKDPIASTEAVLDYLQHLYQTLGQDWLVAVAAYNAGEGTVQRAIQTNRRAGKPLDYWSLPIPARQTTTVPKWLAMIDILRHAEQYNIVFPVIANRPKIAIAELKGQVDLAAAAKIAGISLTELKRLNPGFRTNRSSAYGPHRLVLPVEKLNLFTDRRAQLVVSAGKKAQSNWMDHGSAQQRLYRVQAGDSLSLIAQKQGISVKRLKELNQLTSDRLKIGQQLKVTSTKTSTAQSQRPALRQTAPSTYQVKAGDNLWDIASQLNVDLAALKTLNQLGANSVLKPGQVLQLPVKELPSTTEKTVKIHTVKSGDSLDKIARQHKVKLADLMRWNQLTAKSVLKPGQQLKLTPNAAKG